MWRKEEKEQGQFYKEINTIPTEMNSEKKEQPSNLLSAAEAVAKTEVEAELLVEEEEKRDEGRILISLSTACGRITRKKMSSMPNAKTRARKEKKEFESRKAKKQKEKRLAINTGKGG